MLLWKLNTPLRDRKKDLFKESRIWPGRDVGEQVTLPRRLRSSPQWSD